ncbi:MAG: hypothetical protein IPM36_00110 [Lewinellaceae bacterium]|nr:hypothetical protein [Lewinellaceae bacterium]
MLPKDIQLSVEFGVSVVQDFVTAAYVFKSASAGNLAFLSCGVSKLKKFIHVVFQI